MPRRPKRRTRSACPLLENKSPAAASVFSPAALLREARRQKGLATVDVPSVCILDPDGDILRRLRASGRARRFAGWPCYHTDLHTCSLAGETVGIVGCVVGAPFAVLIVEELFACGCKFLLSLTSAGQIDPAGPPPYFVVIDRAMRDEGTSYHYAAPAEFADADPRLVEAASKALRLAGLRAEVGASWTTDAPFRETAGAIAAARRKGILAVEMEAAALYTFARGKGAAVPRPRHQHDGTGRPRFRERGVRRHHRGAEGARRYRGGRSFEGARPAGGPASEVCAAPCAGGREKARARVEALRYAFDRGRAVECVAGPSSPEIADCLRAPNQLCGPPSTRSRGPSAASRQAVFPGTRPRPLRWHAAPPLCR